MNYLRMTVSVLALLPATAFAADLPSRVLAPAPIVVKNDFSWSGAHVGVLIGGTYSRSQSAFSYGSLGGNGVGFGGDGNVSSTWFNNYYSGTAPSNTAISIYNAANTYYCEVEDDCDTWASDISSTTRAARTNAYAPHRVDGKDILGAYGAELGYTFQSGALVFGFAADGMVFSGKAQQNWSSNGSHTRYEHLAAAASFDIPGYYHYTTGEVQRDSSGSSQYSGSISVAPRWLSTLRLTAGVAEGRYLAFVSGGLAVGSVHAKVSSSYADSNVSACRGAGDFDYAWNGGEDGSSRVTVACGSTVADADGPYLASASVRQDTTASWSRTRNQMRFGYTFGGGVAYAATDNVIVKLEGYYYNLGNVSATVTGVAATSTNGGSASATGAADYTVRTKVDGYIGRAGIAYKF